MLVPVQQKWQSGASKWLSAELNGKAILPSFQGSSSVPDGDDLLQLGGLGGL